MKKQYLFIFKNDIEIEALCKYLVDYQGCNIIRKTRCEIETEYDIFILVKDLKGLDYIRGYRFTGIFSTFNIDLRDSEIESKLLPGIRPKDIFVRYYNENNFIRNIAYELNLT